MRHIFASLSALMLLTTGYSEASAEPLFVEVDTAPPAIETYPHTVYRGQPVYYVHDHWYYRHGPRWAYYRDEPRPLVTYRSRPSHREWHHERHFIRHHRD